MPPEQNITLKIATHTIRLTIKRELEPIYREACKALNERYDYYVRYQPRASVEQIWLYVALEFAVSLKSDMRKHSIAPINEKIQILTALIDQALQQNE